MKTIEIFDTKAYEQELHSNGFGDIIANPFLQRLKKVSFLSTLDFVYDLKPISSRYDHTVGTAYIALKLANHLGLSTFQTNVFVITNLLHDVGHAPFSHNSEPFLLEQKRLYHNGLLSTYLRNNVQVDSDSFSLNELLWDRSPTTANAVSNLIRKKTTDDKILDSLHSSCINCDKIEGSNRTLVALGMEFVDPIALVSSYELENGAVTVSRSNLNVILKFWTLQKEVYRAKIYINEVFSAEAMLTRCLEYLFDSTDKVNNFILSTDDEVLETFKEHPISNEIIELLLTRRFLMPLSFTEPKLFERYKGLMSKNRFDKAQRRLLETEIAKELRTNPFFLISHFSLRKQFHSDLSLLYQGTLFESDENIPIERLNKALYTNKISGDFFEIFYKN